MVTFTYRTASIEQEIEIPRRCGSCRETWSRRVAVKARADVGDAEVLFGDAAEKASRQAARDFDAKVRAEMANEDREALCPACAAISVGALRRYFRGDIKRGLMSRYRRDIVSASAYVLLFLLLVPFVAIAVAGLYSPLTGLRGFVRALYETIRSNPIVSIVCILVVLGAIGGLFLVGQAVLLYPRVSAAVSATSSSDLQRLAGRIYLANKRSFETKGGDWRWLDHLMKVARDPGYIHSLLETPTEKT
jgi:hypothetical protein